MLQNLEERLFTAEDLKQFLESVLAAMCDRLQVDSAFAASINQNGMDFLVSMGEQVDFDEVELSQKISEVTYSEDNGQDFEIFSWGDFWLIPLFNSTNQDELLGLLGVEIPQEDIHGDQKEAFQILIHRAAEALDDRQSQQQVFNTIEDLTPQVSRIQQLRAAARYDGTNVLTSASEEFSLDEGTLTEWVRDALSDYWGGPDLSESPLLQLEIVQNALEEHDGISVKAVRSILREAIDKIRPEGTRRFTLDWVLYNILEMKFLKG